MVDSSVFVVRRSDKTIYDGVDDFLNLQVGVAESTPAMFRLRELGFKNLQPVKSELMNAKKLLVVHRIDAWHGPYLILMYTIINAGLDLSAIRVAYKEMDFEMYIGASLAVPDETVALWQKNLDEMKEDGQYQTILYHAFLQESETKD